jgi:hypothetical protein
MFARTLANPDFFFGNQGKSSESLRISWATAVDATELLISFILQKLILTGALL